MPNGDFKSIQHPLKWPAWVWLLILAFFGTGNLVSAVSQLPGLLGRTGGGAAYVAQAKNPNSLSYKVGSMEKRISELSDMVNRLQKTTEKLAETTANLAVSSAVTSEQYKTIRQELTELQKEVRALYRRQ